MITDAIAKQHAEPYHGCCWVYFTTADEQQGYPETLDRLRAYPLEDLLRERMTFIKASFDRAFGGNAKRALALVEQVIDERECYCREKNQALEQDAIADHRPTKGT